MEKDRRSRDGLWINLIAAAMVAGIILFVLYCVLSVVVLLVAGVGFLMGADLTVSGWVLLACIPGTLIVILFFFDSLK